MEVAHSAKLVVLIEADNIQPSTIPQILTMIDTLGTAQARRVYGDWTRPNLQNWKQHLLAHSVQPIQQFAYPSGKNATDTAMIIDAMDLLHTGRFNGFCLVSSDSDFTRLASRIREEGLVVFGFGERKTPQAFVTACDRFTYIETLEQAKTSTVGKSPPKPKAQPKPKTRPRTPTPQKPNHQLSSQALRADGILVHQLRTAVERSRNPSGWAGLATIGSQLTRRYPGFTPANYGYAKLRTLLVTTELFEFERRSPGSGKPDTVHVWNRRQTP